jgi:hypothetical protein
VNYPHHSQHHSSSSSTIAPTVNNTLTSSEASQVFAEALFSPLSAWSAGDLSEFVHDLGTDGLFKRAAALIAHFGLDGDTLQAKLLTKR